MGECEHAEGGFYCTLNGIRHFVRTAGVSSLPSADEDERGRTPLVLLHGFMQDSRIWAFVLDKLAKDRPVYALDFAGFGKSDAPAGTLPYRVEETVAALRDLVDLVGDERGRVHLMGYSMGGRMALAFVQAQGERVASLILESAGLGEDTPEARASVNARDAAWIERLRTCTVEEFVDYWEGLPLFATQKDMDPAARSLIREIRLSCDVDVLSRCIQGAGQHAMPYFAEAVRAFRMPILYVAGIQDEKYTKVALRLAARGDAVCSLLSCGHSPHLEQPASLCDHVRPFLAQCEAVKAE